MSILSSPIWRAKSFITQVNPANSPTLWSFDGNGFASPSDGRPITAPEQAWMDDYNAQRALMNEATRRAIEDFMRRRFPLGMCPNAISPLLGTLPDPLIRTTVRRTTGSGLASCLLI